MNCHAVVPVVSAEVIKAHKLTGSDIAVWYALCSFAQWEYVKGCAVRSKPGSCFPADKAVAEKAACADRSVRRSIIRLESAGLVERVKRVGELGEQRSNEYILKAPL